MTVGEFGPRDLPEPYRAVQVHTHDEPVSALVELTHWLADEEQRRGHRPVTLFRRVREYPGAVVLGNPCPKPVLLAAMGLDPLTWLAELGRRTRGSVPPGCTAPGGWRELNNLDDVPVIQHRPGDAGRYITAGVTVTRSLRGDVNLGVYRIQVVDGRKIRIFFDQRTDAHRNWREHIETGHDLPITVFIGADPVYLLVAASRLPVDGSDFDVAARLLGHPVVLDPELVVPVDAQYVLCGTVGATEETEGPFAEFKGYYVPERQSPVGNVHQVLAARRPYYPTIVTGSESGLTLMSLQNEYLLYSHLVERRFPVRSVTYPHAARAEFLALIQCDDPTPELLRIAMEFDPRAKVIACGTDPRNFWQTVALHGFSAVTDTYFRKGVEYGQRIGILFDHETKGYPVEF